MRQQTRRIGIVGSIAGLCVLAWAAVVTVQAGEKASELPQGDGLATAASIDLAGRWEGRAFELSRRTADCSGVRCQLTLDISRCANGWCGVEVLDAERRCGTTALKLDGGADTGGPSTLFKGQLALAKGTEPYVVEAYLMTWEGDGARTALEITGDTGGEFRMFRRSFPFNATLARVGEASCRPESTVSLLD